MGSRKAADTLNGPECPEAMEYLVALAYRLVGRDGDGRLSHREIKAWSELYDMPLEVYEVDALIALNDAIRHTDEQGKEGGS